MELWRISSEIWSSRLQKPMGQSTLHHPERRHASVWSHFWRTFQKKSTPTKPVYSECRGKHAFIFYHTYSSQYMKMYPLPCHLFWLADCKTFLCFSAATTVVFKLLVRVGQDHTRCVNGMFLSVVLGYFFICQSLRIFSPGILMLLVPVCLWCVLLCVIF